uniref:Atr25 n=1 Tax=Streptomyces atratus TaxID=1893 RepID=A0A411PQL7_STRAR|nr:Atr25 [Streptomyces atratus]
MRVACIGRHREEFGVQPICDALRGTDAEIAPSTYCAAVRRSGSARAARDRDLPRRSPRSMPTTTVSTAPARCTPRSCGTGGRWLVARDRDLPRRSPRSMPTTTVSTAPARCTPRSCGTGGRWLVARDPGDQPGAFGVRLPVRSLPENPTVAAPAAELTAGCDHDPFDVLLPLRPGGSGPGVFCLHPGCRYRVGLLGPAAAHPGRPPDLRDPGARARPRRGTALLRPRDGRRLPRPDSQCPAVRSLSPGGPVPRRNPRAHDRHPAPGGGRAGRAAGRAGHRPGHPLRGGTRVSRTTNRTCRPRYWTSAAGQGTATRLSRWCTSR